jgi:putative ABC transport system permease protein
MLVVAEPVGGYGLMLREWLARLREWRERLLGVFRASPADEELKEELDHHLSMVEEELVRRGYASEEAARLARARHGQTDNALERLRDQRSVPLFGVFTLDVKLGLRMLRKQLGLSLIGGIAMMVGIAIVSSVFMLFDVLFWTTTMPIDDDDRVVAIQVWEPERSRRGGISIDDFERWRDRARSLESVGAFRTVEHDFYRGDGRIDTVQVAEMSAAGFRIARVPAVLGRTLAPDDERPDAAPVIVLGYDEWQSRFAGDSGVLGRVVRLDDTFYTVVGVMPEDFGFPLNHRLWIPLRDDAAGGLPAPPGGAVFARLAPGASLETAQAELSTLGLLPAEQADAPAEPPRVRVLAYTSNFIDDIDPDSLSQRALGARLAMLLIALLLIPPCANVGMLVYARMVTRQEEIAVRTALGASRARIVAQLFVEMLVLAMLSATLALVAVRWFAQFVEATFLRGIARLPFWYNADLSLDTVLFAFGLAVACATVVGLVPALKMTSRFARPGLSALDARNRTRLGPIWTALVVTQVAFSFAALPTAVEIGWGVLRQNVLGPGFAADEYLTVRLGADVEAPETDSDTAALAVRLQSARQELMRRLEADPRVYSRVSASTAVPGEGAWRLFEIEGIEGVSAHPDAAVSIGVDRSRQIGIDESYLETYEIPLIAGRAFEPGEFVAESRAVLVNQAFVERNLPGVNPLGRRIRFLSLSSNGPAGTVDHGPWHEIVGVVADRPAHPYRGSVFYPAAPASTSLASIGFRVGPDGAGLRGTILATARSVDPLLRIEAVRSLQELYDAQAAGNYVGGTALIAATLAILLLSAAGTYALTSFTVNLRRREIGIRMALGARPRRLLGGIFRRALRQVGIGAGIGFGIALLIEAKVPIDRLGGWHVPGVLPAAAAFMLVIGVIAVLGPARRTLGIDPTEALRDDG